MITERHVQAIWYDRAFRPSALYTRRGTPLAVVDPGAWNLGPGPDFLDAVLEVGKERRRVKGDVEVHLHPSDWTFHRHGEDPAYANVVLHVTWECGPPPETLPPGAMSLWIGRFIASDPGFSADAIDLGAYPYARLPLGERPCCRRLKSEPEFAQTLLAASGRRRLLGKARRLQGFFAAVGRHQLFYREVMNALGYSRNSAAFSAVASAVPYGRLVSEPETAAAALLAAAGFAAIERGGRPLNAPELRLQAAADLFTATPVMALLETSDFSRDGCRAMIAMMSENHRIGRGRCAAVLANVVVPFALADGRLRDVPSWLPAEDLSAPVRLTAFRLFGRDHNPALYAGNGLLVQGLIGIHREFCLQVHPDCDACRLLEERT